MVWQQLFGGDKPAARVSAPVTLHIYDLGPAFAGANMVGRAIGTGAFHAGVEVYGGEWSFSCGQDGPYRSGIFKVPPRGCDAHVYREAVPMGDTTMSQREVRQLIDKLFREWPGSSYDLLRKNCCHFSDEFCIRLGVGPIPVWVTSLAGVGAMLRSGIRIAVEGVGAAPQVVAGGAAAAPALLWDAAAALGDAAAALGGAFVRNVNVKALEDGPGPVPTPQRPGSAAKELRRGITQAVARDVSRPAESASGPWNVGDLVDVWSNSHQAWCAGKIEALRPDNMVAVTFKLPMDGTDNLASKLLPADHQHLRHSVAQPVSSGAKAGCPYARGDPVEVYSNSQKAWCQGHVEQIQGNILFLAFRLPGAKADEWSQKQLPADHKDVRKAAAPAATGSGNAAGGGAQNAPVPPAPRDSAAVTARKEAASVKLAAALRGRDLPAIEEACTAAEAAGVSASEVEAARVAVVLLAAQEELDEARKSGDAVWIEKACRRARDAGLKDKDIEPARQEFRRINALADLGQALRCCDAELIEEACEVAKAAGVSAAELEAARREASAIRAREAEAAKAAAGRGEATLGTRPINASEVMILPSIGDWVEVYSNSHKAWCLGRITKVTPDAKTVVFQLPGAKPDEWNEKSVPNNCSGVLRRLAAAAAGPARGSPPAWSPEEGGAYGRAFKELAGGGGSGASSARADEKVSADRTAEYLKGSGLPRKVLKQIWLVANPNSAAELSTAEFAVCLRLVGHCQAVLASGDMAAAEVLADGGEVLKSILQGELMYKPPPTLPRFHGHLLEGRPASGVECIEV